MNFFWLLSNFASRLTTVGPGPQVVRYTALVSGVFYGIYHRRTLQKARDQQNEQHAVHQRQRLIHDAKEAWKRKQQGGVDDGKLSLRSSDGNIVHF